MYQVSVCISKSLCAYVSQQRPDSSALKNCRWQVAMCAYLAGASYVVATDLSGCAYVCVCVCVCGRAICLPV